MFLREVGQMSDIFKYKEDKIRRAFELRISISEKIDSIAKEYNITKSEVAEKAFIHLFELLEKEKEK